MADKNKENAEQGKNPAQSGEQPNSSAASQSNSVSNDSLEMDNALLKEDNEKLTEANDKLQKSVDSLTKKVNDQKVFIRELKEEQSKGPKLDVSGKIYVLNTEGDKFQFLGKQHRYKKQLITAETLANNPALVDELLDIKAGFLI
jgi:hypothetical protein